MPAPVIADRIATLDPSLLASANDLSWALDALPGGDQVRVLLLDLSRPRAPLDDGSARVIGACTLPVVAAIEGEPSAAALSIALAADLRVAATGSRFAIAPGHRPRVALLTGRRLEDVAGELSAPEAFSI